MGDLAESYRATRDHQKMVKAKRLEKNLRQLARLEREDTKLRVSSGQFYFVEYGGRGAQFWPSTGSTILQFGRDRSTKYFTANQLVAFLKGCAA